MTAKNRERLAMLEAQVYEAPESAYTVAGTSVCDPLDVSMYEGPDALKWAIENVPAGSVTVIEDGAYPIGKVAKSNGGRFMARNKHGVRIQGLKPGDTISMVDGKAIGPLVLAGLYIEASERSAWMTLDAGGPYDVSFEDCTIDGGYAPAQGSGFDSKWGFVPHRWAGYASRCTFQNVRREHGIYCHTPMADILLHECMFWRNGRTGAQFVGRENEGGYSQAELLVHGCTFEDNGLKDGGSSLTVQGIKSLLVESSQFWIGRNANFRANYMAKHPEKHVFSTGHIVNWSDQGRCLPTEVVMLKDVICWSAPGDGSAAAIQVKNSKALVVSGSLSVDTGFNNHAAELGAGMQIVLQGVTSTHISGKVTIG